jgi:osmotically-inducible protein OsmY
LARTTWAPRAGVRITVTDGVVTLAGTVPNNREREALRAAAENVPGVKGIRDHIVWVEPVFRTVIGAPTDEPALPVSGE